MDGNLSDAPWQQAPAADSFLNFGGRSPAPIGTSVRIAFDPENLYLAFTCDEPDMGSLKAQAGIPRDHDQVWQDDCVEVFLDPSRQGQSFFHLIVSAGGGQYDEKFTGPPGNSMAGDSGWNGGWTSAASRDAGHWYAEIKIPFQAIGGQTPKPGDVWGIQLTRSRQPHPNGIYTWTPVPDKVLANPAHFGSLAFENNALQLLELLADPPGLGTNQLVCVLRNNTEGPLAAVASLQLGPGERDQKILQNMDIPPHDQARAKFQYTVEMLPNSSTYRFSVCDRGTGRSWLDIPLDLGNPSLPVRLRFDGLFLKADIHVGLATLRDQAWNGHLSLQDSGGNTLATESFPLRATRFTWKTRLSGLHAKTARIHMAVGPAGQPSLASAFLEYSGLLEPYETTARNNLIPEVARPERLGQMLIRIQPPPEKISLPDFPVQCGVPFPRGALRSPEKIRLLGANGKSVPCQTRVLAVWDPPGSKNASIQWLLVSFQAALQGNPEYTLQYGSRVAKPRTRPPRLKAESSNVGITVDTGVLRFTVSRASPDLIHQAWLDADRDGNYEEAEKMLGESGAKGLYLYDHEGTLFRSAWDSEASLEIEEQGPLVITLKASGHYVNANGGRLNQWVTRLKAYAGKPYLRLYHTCVVTEDSARKRFRDIGVELPLAAPPPSVISFSKGTRAELSSSLPEPVQRDNLLFHEDALKKVGESLFLHQDSQKHFSILADASELASGERCGHWFDSSVAGRGLAMALRWSWQNFPCGFEAFQDGRMRVHLWTQRGKQDLDFRPRPYLESRGRWEVWQEQIMHVKDRRHEYPPELGGTMVADGIGLSKTHELMLLFHAAPETNQAAEISYLLQKPVLAYPSPEWLRKTEALGRIHPYDPLRFPQTEKVLHLYMDKFLKDQADDVSIGDQRYGDSYGAFDFGDTLHQRKYAHRYWSHRFYVTPSMFWMQYARTGDRRTFEFGEANARHVMDIDTCHTSFEDRLRPGYFNHDDAGVIHWAGYGPSYVCTNDYFHYLIRYYHLTGYERARDVALEIAEMVRENSRKGFPSWSHRASGFTLWAAVELYRFTWDEQFKKLADHIARQIVDNVRDGLSTGYSGSDAVDFTLAYIFNGAIAYHQLTGDPAIADWMINQVSYMARWKIVDGQGGSFNQWDGVAYVYHLTGDSKYLELAKPFLESISKTAEKDIPDFIGSRVWWMFKAGYLLDALAQSGLDVSSDGATDARPESTSGEIQVMDDRDVPFQLDVRLVRIATDDPRVHPAFGDLKSEAENGGPVLVLYGPNGEVCDRRPYPPAPREDPWYHRGGWVESFMVRKDGQNGIYRLRLETRTGVLFQVQLVTNTLGKAMFSGGSGDGLSPGSRYPPVKRYYFYVPPATEKFLFQFLLFSYWYDFTLQVYDPLGLKVVDRNLAMEENRPRDGWLGIEIPCPPESRDKFWSVQLGSYGEVRIFKLSGVPAYFGESSESAFRPETDPPK